MLILKAVEFLFKNECQKKKLNSNLIHYLFQTKKIIASGEGWGLIKLIVNIFNNLTFRNDIVSEKLIKKNYQKFLINKKRKGK